MRLVEHLHIAEILREAEENRQRFLAGGQGPADPLSVLKLDLYARPSGPASNPLIRGTVDVRPPKNGIEWMSDSQSHKDAGMSSFSPRLCL